jgi:hypothetical protein
MESAKMDAPLSAAPTNLGYILSHI